MHKGNEWFDTARHVRGLIRRTVEDGVVSQRPVLVVGARHVQVEGLGALQQVSHGHRHMGHLMLRRCTIGR